ncbi:maleylacetate reductase [Trichodelitschia bisporula]|uniref:Maleylacetate reductase n=1 Tax=Trichodelitschia bisporula TaxID=703511 RepID=A0A6G1I4S6_9PEZI|nr:maleylacetate reductase [Trichodelitschia bisporula]
MESTLKPLSGLWKPLAVDAVYYGPDTVDKHLLSVLPTPSSKAYIITGKSLATKTPLIKAVEQRLGTHHAGTFSSLSAHTPIAELNALIDAITAQPDIDTLLSIGGGSPIDATKAAVFRFHEATGRWLTHIAIPTTLSAAECTCGAGYTNEEGVKSRLAHPNISPKTILYDVSFARHTPPRLWKSTAFRALDHAVETMYNPYASETSKVMAIEAARSLFHLLPQYQAGATDDVMARMHLAAYHSLAFLGLNLKGSIGLSHTLGYALGSPYGIPHGITSTLTLGHVVKLKAQGPAAGQIARLARAVGISKGDDKQDAEAFGDAILQLVRTVDLYGTLADYGVGGDQLEIIVRRGTGLELGAEGFAEVEQLVSGLF